MKDKFLRIISPITLAVICILDLGVIVYGIYAVKRLIYYPSTAVILFAALDAVALVIGILVTKEVLTNGIWFYDDELEFTALDENNIFAYDSIEKVELYKDDSASFTKDFFDRQSDIILTLKDGKVHTIELGITTKHTLDAAGKEIAERSNAELIYLKPERTKKEDSDND